MKPALIFLAVFAMCAYADEASDRAAIERVIVELNEFRPSEALPTPARLFSAGADLPTELASLAGAAAHPWSEVTPPHFASRRMQFVTPDVALVDAVNTQFGTQILKRVTGVVMVMKREGDNWRIAALRWLMPPMPEISRALPGR